MYTANNFNVHRASFRMQPPLSSPSYFPTSYFSHGDPITYVYSSNHTPSSVALFGARPDAPDTEILRYYSAI